MGNSDKNEGNTGLIKQEYRLQAKTLRAAVANLNEQTSLVFEKGKGFPASASPSFYVDRPDNPMEELKTFLLTSPGYDKILFSGHMGSGKSTELNRFSILPEIEGKFFVVKYSISEILNIIDIDYIDFMLSFAAYLYIKASDSGISFTGGILKSLEKWMNYFKSGMDSPEEIKKTKSTAKKIYDFFNRVSVILLRELALRDKAREAIKRNINGLVTVINTLVTYINSELGDKELLVVIDDLEKIPDITKAEELFINAGTYMSIPMCKIIYTVPIALYYSIKFKQLTSTFGNSYFLPNIKVKEKDGTKGIDPSGCMKEFLKKRIDMNRIDKEAVDIIIENSAGVVRELVRILRNACIKSISKGLDTIDADTARAVITELRNQYERGLEKRHIDVLKNVDQGKPVEDHNTLMELFHSRVLLEYTNGDRWTAINPIVKPLLK